MDPISSSLRKSTIIQISIDGKDLKSKKEWTKIEAIVESRVQELVSKIQITHEKFFDPDFGPNESDEFGAISLYGSIDSTPAPSGTKYPSPDSLIWERPHYLNLVSSNSIQQKSSKFRKALAVEADEIEEKEEEDDDDDDDNRNEENEEDEDGEENGEDEEEEDEFALPGHDFTKEVWCDRGQLFVDGTSSGDVVQGQLGDCWFLGALAVLGTQEKRVRACFWRQNQYQELGLFVVRFFKDSSLLYVVVDDRIPLREKDKRCVFARSSDPNELWVCLIEKAYAKVFGSYSSLIGGSSHTALADLSGLAARMMVLKPGFPGFIQETHPEDLWALLKRYQEYGSLLGCSIQTNPKDKHKVEADAGSGLYYGHAYSLLGVGEIPVKKIDILDQEEAGKNKSQVVKGQDEETILVRLVKLRNPWGRGEWEGEWSDRSEMREKYKEEIDKAFSTSTSSSSHLIDDSDPSCSSSSSSSSSSSASSPSPSLVFASHENNQTNFNDGAFFMPFDQWSKRFTSLFAAIRFPGWAERRISGRWTGEVGGNRHMGTWISNPKFSLRINSNQTPSTLSSSSSSSSSSSYRLVFIGLYLTDARLRMGKEYFKDPLYSTALSFDIVDRNGLEISTLVIPPPSNNSSSSSSSQSNVKRPLVGRYSPPSSSSSEDPDSNKVPPPPYQYGGVQIELYLPVDTDLFLVPSLYKRGQSGDFYFIVSADCPPSCLSLQSYCSTELENRPISMPLPVPSPSSSNPSYVSSSSSSGSSTLPLPPTRPSTSSSSSTSATASVPSPTPPPASRLSVSQFFEKKESLRERLVQEASRLRIGPLALQSIFADKKSYSTSSSFSSGSSSSSSSSKGSLTYSVFKRRMMDLGFSLTDLPDEDLVVFDMDSDGTISPKEFLEFFEDGAKMLFGMGGGGGAEGENRGGFSTSSSSSLSGVLPPSPPPPPPIDDVIFKPPETEGYLGVSVLAGRGLREIPSWIGTGITTKEGEGASGVGGGAGVGGTGGDGMKTEGENTFSVSDEEGNLGNRKLIRYDPISAERRRNIQIQGAEREKETTTKERERLEALLKSNSLLPSLSLLPMQTSSALSLNSSLSTNPLPLLLQTLNEDESKSTPLDPPPPSPTLLPLSSLNLSAHLASHQNQSQGGPRSVMAASVASSTFHKAGQDAGIKLHSDGQLRTGELKRTVNLLKLRSKIGPNSTSPNPQNNSSSSSSLTALIPSALLPRQQSSSVSLSEDSLGYNVLRRPGGASGSGTMGGGVPGLRGKDRWRKRDIRFDQEIQDYLSFVPSLHSTWKSLKDLQEEEDKKRKSQELKRKRKEQEWEQRKRDLGLLSPSPRSGPSGLSHSLVSSSFLEFPSSPAPRHRKGTVLLPNLPSQHWIEGRHIGEMEEHDDSNRINSPRRRRDRTHHSPTSSYNFPSETRSHFSDIWDYVLDKVITIAISRPSSSLSRSQLNPTSSSFSLCSNPVLSQQALTRFDQPATPLPCPSRSRGPPGGKGAVKGMKGSASQSQTPSQGAVTNRTTGKNSNFVPSVSNSASGRIVQNTRRDLIEARDQMRKLTEGKAQEQGVDSGEYFEVYRRLICVPTTTNPELEGDRVGKTIELKSSNVGFSCLAHELFSKFDKDLNGIVTEEEFISTLKEMELQLDEEEIFTLLNRFRSTTSSSSSYSSDQIDWKSFLDFFNSIILSQQEEPTTTPSHPPLIQVISEIRNKCHQILLLMKLNRISSLEELFKQGGHNEIDPRDALSVSDPSNPILLRRTSHSKDNTQSLENDLIFSDNALFNDLTVEAAEVNCDRLRKIGVSVNPSQMIRISRIFGFSVQLLMTFIITAKDSNSISSLILPFQTAQSKSVSFSETVSERTKDEPTSNESKSEFQSEKSKVPIPSSSFLSPDREDMNIEGALEWFEKQIRHGLKARAQGGGSTHHSSQSFSRVALKIWLSLSSSSESSIPFSTLSEYFASMVEDTLHSHKQHDRHCYHRLSFPQTRLQSKKKSTSLPSTGLTPSIPEEDESKEKEKDAFSTMLTPRLEETVSSDEENPENEVRLTRTIRPRAILRSQSFLGTRPQILPSTPADSSVQIQSDTSSSSSSSNQPEPLDSVGPNEQYCYLCGARIDLLARILVDSMVYSPWNRPIRRRSNTESHLSVHLHASDGHISSSSSPLIEELSLSGFQSFLFQRHVETIERKLRFILELELSQGSGSASLLTHFYLNSTGRKGLVLARDPLTGKFYKLPLNLNEEASFLPKHLDLRTQFSSKIDQYLKFSRASVLKLSVPSFSASALNEMDLDSTYGMSSKQLSIQSEQQLFNPDSLLLYNPLDTPSEDETISQLLSRLRLVQSFRTPSRLILAEDPRFISQLKSLFDSSAPELPFFTVINDLNILFEADNNDLKVSSDSNQPLIQDISSDPQSFLASKSKSVSLEKLIFGAIRKHRSLFTFLSNSHSSLRVVLSSYNGGKRVAMKWSEMLSYLCDFKNPFVTIQLLPRFLEAKDYMYFPPELTTEDVFSGEDKQDHNCVLRSHTDKDGGSSPTWNAKFKLLLKTPQLTNCKVITTEISKIKIDGKYRYVVVMIRQGSLKRPKASENASDPARRSSKLIQNTQTQDEEIETVGTSSLSVVSSRSSLHFYFLTIYDPRTATEYQCGLKDCTLSQTLKKCFDSAANFAFSLQATIDPTFKLPSLADIRNELTDAADQDKLILGPAVTPRLLLNVYNQRGKLEELIGSSQISLSSVLSDGGLLKPIWVTLNYKKEATNLDADLEGYSSTALKTLSNGGEVTVAGEILIDLTFRSMKEFTAQLNSLAKQQLSLEKNAKLASAIQQIQEFSLTPVSSAPLLLVRRPVEEIAQENPLGVYSATRTVLVPRPPSVQPPNQPNPSKPVRHMVTTPSSSSPNNSKNTSSPRREEKSSNHNDESFDQLREELFSAQSTNSELERMLSEIKSQVLELNRQLQSQETRLKNQSALEKENERLMTQVKISKIDVERKETENKSLITTNDEMVKQVHALQIELEEALTLAHPLRPFHSASFEELVAAIINILAVRFDQKMSASNGGLLSSQTIQSRPSSPATQSRSSSPLNSTTPTSSSSSSSSTGANSAYAPQQLLTPLANILKGYSHRETGMLTAKGLFMSFYDCNLEITHEQSEMFLQKWAIADKTGVLTGPESKKFIHYNNMLSRLELYVMKRNKKLNPPPSKAPASPSLKLQLPEDTSFSQPLDTPVHPPSASSNPKLLTKAPSTFGSDSPRLDPSDPWVWMSEEEKEKELERRALEEQAKKAKELAVNPPPPVEDQAPVYRTTPSNPKPARGLDGKEDKTLEALTLGGSGMSSPMKDRQVEAAVQAALNKSIPWSDVPLPNGWEKRKDPKKNQFYYLNHEAKSTQWRHPLCPPSEKDKEKEKEKPKETEIGKGKEKEGGGGGGGHKGEFKKHPMELEKEEKKKKDKPSKVTANVKDKAKEKEKEKEKSSTAPLRSSPPTTPSSPDPLLEAAQKAISSHK